MNAASLASLLLALLWGGFGLGWLLRRGRASRRAAATVLLLAAFLLAPHVVSKPGGTNAPPQRTSVRTGSAAALPDWFLALGYDPADADASGIPDLWTVRCFHRFGEPTHRASRNPWTSPSLPRRTTTCA